MSEKDVKKDRVYVGRACPDGSVPVFRPKEGGMDVTVVRPVAEGKPIMGKPVSLEACDDGDGHWMEYLDGSPLEEPEPEGACGPAMVNSKTYRDNWDRMFGSSGLFGSKVGPGKA
jgi:hypothetical protein